MENELVAAEIYLHPVNTADATRDIDEQLKYVEAKIQDYTVHLSGADYAVAIASGLLSGAIDSTIVGETDLFQQFSKDRLKTQFEEALEKVKILLTAEMPVDGPKRYRPVHTAAFVDNEFLKAFTISPTILGLLASVVLQMGLGGMIQKDDDGKYRLFPEQNKKDPFYGISQEDRIFLLIIAAIVGILRWLIVTAEHEPLHSAEHGTKVMKNLRKLIRETPAFSKVVDQIEKWQKRAANEIKKVQKANRAPMSLDQLFFSFFTMLAAAPEFEQTNLHKIMPFYQNAHQVGLDRIPIIDALTKQAFPALINEILVRTFYFAEHLAMELQTIEEIEEIDWGKVVPFGNKSVERMMTIAAMTLNVADIADSAVRAAIDSHGDMLCFGTRFMARFNVAAEGRVAVAIIREIKDEREAQALYDARLELQRTKTARVLEILDTYQKELEERVSAYLAEDIEAFLMGIEMMDQGLYINDSDLVIRGNVVIQRVLGREPQFTNQQEFDDLMDSDIPLKL